MMEWTEQLYMLVLLWLMILKPVVVGGKTDFLVNCGLPRSAPSTTFLGRVWRSDDDPSFSPPNINAVSYSAASASGGVVPYLLARIFNSTLRYSFPVTVPGPIFLRLYFSSTATYNNIPSSQFSLSLTANNFTLLHNFGPHRDSQVPSCASNNPVNYEFFLTFEKSTRPETLNLSFSPGECSSGSCLGFINGIEIVSAPEGLYISKALGTYDFVNNPQTGYSVVSTRAFQTAYRLNVGGSDVQPVNDAGDMGRAWYNDEGCVAGGFAGEITYPPVVQHPTMSGIKYSMIPEYTAPKIVYGTQRFIGVIDPRERERERKLSWRFEVDAGFDYLVRLHFCEMDLNVTKALDRAFYVELNGMKASQYVDVWEMGGGRLGSPIYKDYVVRVDDAKAPLMVTLLPIIGLEEVLLNGLEILKLNTPDGNLSVNHPPLSQVSTSHKSNTSLSKSSFSAILGGALGGGALLILLCALLAGLIVQRKANDLNQTSKTKSNDVFSSLPSELCRRFSLGEIRIATSDFDNVAIIGTGGFGKVYQGSIDVAKAGGGTHRMTVAIKRLNPRSNQGAVEFRTEIEMLSRLRHLNLVSLIGYCVEQGEMILIYEYMPHGSLRDHLNISKTKCNDVNMMDHLKWNQRLSICLGASRGVHYLHTCAKQAIIHRDIKSSNILLDDKWTAKVSYFGLSRFGPASETGTSHVSTKVKGSFGYMDPEYFKLQQLTEKSDVFSFGVVLFEVLCARAAVDPKLAERGVNLAMWARSHCRNGTLHSIIDPNLRGQIATECLNKFGEIAEMCVREMRSERPSMGDVVGALEFALQLQTTAEKNSSVNGGQPDRFVGIIRGGGIDNSSKTDPDEFSITSGETLSLSISIATSTGNTEKHAYRNLV